MLEPGGGPPGDGGAAAGQPPAWQRRFRAPRVSLPSWAAAAPDRCSYATDASGVWQLVSWDRAHDRHTVLTDKPTGVTRGQVLPDGSGVVWFDDHAGDEVGRWVVAPFDGGPPRPLAPTLAPAWSAGLSVREGRLAVGTAGRDGFTIHAGDRAGTRVVYRHRRQASVAGLSRDGALLAISHTEHGGATHPDLRVVDPVSGTAVADLSDGPRTRLLAAGWSRVPGDQRLAVVSDRSGRLRPELWAPPVGTRVPLWVDLPGEVWVVDWWPDGSALLLGHDHLGRTDLHRYDLTGHRHQPLAVADGSVVGARVRDDEALWYAFTSSSTMPVVRVRDADGDRPLLTPPGEPAPGGAPYASLHVDNGEGGRVHTFVATPAGPGPHPLVVEVHGGPHAQAADVFDPQVQAWVDHGFAVAMPNYRGSTGYGTRWEDALEGDPGRPELVDLLAVRDHLVRAGVADAGRTVLAGASWGGYLTLMGLGTQPHAWAAGVAVVPVADYPAAYEDESPALRELDRSLFAGTPAQRPELYRARSPLTHVGSVGAPLLIVAGRNDTRCPKRQVDNYVRALAARGVPHRYEVHDAGHGTHRVEELVGQQALALDFVAEHLGTTPARR